MDHEEQGVAPAHALLDRLNVAVDRRLRRAPAGARAHRAASEAGVVVQGARRGRRRRVPAARAQGRPRAAGARREVRLPGPRARAASTARRWTGSSIARARSASSIVRRRRSCSAATCSRSACNPGPRVGEILKAVYEQQMDGKVTTIDDASPQPSRWCKARFYGGEPHRRELTPMPAGFAWPQSCNVPQALPSSPLPSCPASALALCALPSPFGSLHDTIAAHGSLHARLRRSSRPGRFGHRRRPTATLTLDGRHDGRT